MKITSDRRLVLIREVYKVVFRETETFRRNNIGSDLAYLLGAIANNSIVSYTNEPILRLFAHALPNVSQHLEIYCYWVNEWPGAFRFIARLVNNRRHKIK